MINRERLQQTIEELASFGAQPDGSITRYAYTEIEKKANDYVEQLMKSIGLTTYYDAVGNLIGELAAPSNKPAIVLGSHIDTVPNGGKYDGALGVLSAIEVVTILIEQQINLQHPIKIIAFKDEEGARFQFGMIGSRAAAGTLEAQDLDRVDADGITLKEAMYAQGFSPHFMHDVVLNDVYCYLELHIEQGKVLESKEASVGIVSGIAGPLWKQYRITGVAEHAGATPMSQRHDPLVAASLIIAQIEQLALQFEQVVATVGQLAVKPNGVNVIPNEVTFTVDIRDIDEARRATLEQQIDQFVKKTVSERSLKAYVQTLQRVPSALCDDSIQANMQQALKKLNLPVVTLPSGAGHDAMQFHGVFPIGMLFVRSKDGISHSAFEFSSLNDIEDGANALFETVKLIDQI